MTGAPLLSRPVHVSDIGEDGLVVTIEASPAEREALAAAYELRAVRDLRAEIRLAMTGRAGVLAEGHLHADIVQTCVVSLVPVDQAIDEDFSVRFSQKGETTSAVKSGGEIHLDPADLDPPEPLTGPTIDLGPIVAEHFVLAIDPYPRAPGAELPPEAADPEGEAAASPFAALAGLRRRPGGSR
jgi:uncharacterized metal-binding protein YceD (DUF177 family)